MKSTHPHSWLDLPAFSKRIADGANVRMLHSQHIFTTFDDTTSILGAQCRPGFLLNLTQRNATVPRREAVIILEGYLWHVKSRALCRFSRIMVGYKDQKNGGTLLQSKVNILQCGVPLIAQF